MFVIVSKGKAELIEWMVLLCSRFGYANVV